MDEDEEDDDEAAASLDDGEELPFGECSDAGFPVGEGFSPL